MLHRSYLERKTKEQIARIRLKEKGYSDQEIADIENEHFDDDYDRLKDEGKV